MKSHTTSFAKQHGPACEKTASQSESMHRRVPRGHEGEATTRADEPSYLSIPYSEREIKTLFDTIYKNNKKIIKRLGEV